MGKVSVQTDTIEESHRLSDRGPGARGGLGAASRSPTPSLAHSCSSPSARGPPNPALIDLAAKNPIGGALTAPFWLRQHWKPHGLASGQESIDSSRTNGAKNEGSRRADGQWV